MRDPGFVEQLRSGREGRGHDSDLGHARGVGPAGLAMATLGLERGNETPVRALVVGVALEDAEQDVHRLKVRS